MDTLHTEDAVFEELNNLSQNNQAVEELAQIIQSLNQHGPGQSQALLNAQMTLAAHFEKDPRKFIEALIAILSLPQFLDIDEQTHKTIAVLLGSFIQGLEINSDSDVDRNFWAQCLNRLSVCLFKIVKGPARFRNVCLAFAKLLNQHEFFSDPGFSDEVYFRYIKKFCIGCNSEEHLNKVLTLLNVLSLEDSKLMSSNIPKIINDSLTILGSCMKYIVGNSLSANKNMSLDCIARINDTIASLLVYATENYAKYSRQFLEIMSNNEFCTYLTEV
jgi:hypothetical protein